MTALLDTTTKIAANVADHAVALFAAAWPRSLAAREVARLTGDGYSAGTTCDLDFSLSFDEPALAEKAVPLLAQAGFTPADRPDSERGFLILRTRGCLRPYELARLTARVERAARAAGAYAELIGPASAATGTVPTNAHEADRQVPIQGEPQRHLMAS